MTEDELVQSGWSRIEDDGFVGLVGPFWERRDADGLSLGFVAAPKHKNRGGVVQGGMLATLADRTLGFTARILDPERAQATIQIDIQFIDSAQIGDFVTARATLLRETSTLAFLSGKLESGGRLIANVTGIWRIRPGVKLKPTGRDEN